MADQALVKKIRFKDDQKALLMNAPANFANRLSDHEISAAIPLEAEKFEFILLFATNQQELNHFGPLLFNALEQDGLLWVAYPKKSGKITTDLTRDTGWEILKDYALTGISIISLDDTWSALRLGKVKGGSSGMLAELYKGEHEKLRTLYEKVEEFTLSLDKKIILKQRKNYSPFYAKRQFMAIKPVKGKLVIGLRLPASFQSAFPAIDIIPFKLNESLNFALIMEKEEEFNDAVKNHIKAAFEFK